MGQVVTVFHWGKKTFIISRCILCTHVLYPFACQSIVLVSISTIDNAHNFKCLVLKCLQGREGGGHGCWGGFENKLYGLVNTYIQFQVVSRLMK